MNAPKTWALNWVLKPGASGSAELAPQDRHLSLGGSHKWVIAWASLSSVSDHQVYAPNAAASVFFTQIVQGGVAKPANSMPIVIGENISDLHFNFQANRRWARASIVVMAFD